ncbi:hypothetical protein BDZ91DRAFT_787135 [Kalaharituber pfeilii]|nr:hypothetical protein BDZ91DRAFT_787135 [Kalaharituber pfeilii]
MENTGNDRKYMDGHGNDWKQVEASRISGNKLADTCFQHLLWLSKRFYSFRQVLRLSGGFCGFPASSGDPGSSSRFWQLPTQEEAFRRHQAHKTPPQTASPTTEDATTRGGVGIVIHGIALRKDLGKVKKWLAAANESLGKIKGIRWLRKRNLLEEAGKTTSSVVVYLEKEVDVEKVRLSGRWHRSARYESERRRR